MSRPRRAPRPRRETLSDGEVAWARGELTEAHPEYQDVCFFTPAGRLREVWLEVHAEPLYAEPGAIIHGARV